MTSLTHKQLPLQLARMPGATFAQYVAGQNKEALSVLQKAVLNVDGASEAAMILVWGERGTGKTHLLQAACACAGDQGKDAIYIDCGCLAELRPDIFEDLEGTTVIALDSIEALAGSQEWEQALFAFLRRHREGSGLLLLSSGHSPGKMAFQLPDLQTRLVGWSTVYQLRLPDDATRGEVIQRQAQVRGFEIGEDVVRYLLQHYPRDMHTITTMLDEFDQASLVHQRRITIPFLKSLQGRS